MTNKFTVKFLTKEPFPYGMAATNRIINYAKGLLLAGLSPLVYTIHATYKGTNAPPSKGKFKGIDYQYANSSTRSNSFFIRRINDFLDFFRSCCNILFDKKSTVNIIYLNSFFKEFCFIILSKIRGKKVIRELCEYPYYHDCFKADASLKILFPLYDGFIAISENLYQLALKHKSKNAKVIKVPILIDSKDTQDIKPYKHKRQYIFHGGTLKESKDAMISTIKAFAIANEQLKGSVDFIIAGPPSSDLPKIKEIITKHNLEGNVIFLGVIKHEDVMKYLAGASVCVLNKNDNLQNQYGFSTKLSDVLLSETAVITTNIGEACNWLKDGESAYITEPHNPQLIANLIVEAFSNDESRKKIAKAGKSIASNNFDIKIQGHRLANFLKEL